jgi:hypothetical protein
MNDLYLMKKKECPSCAMEIPAKSKACPICSYEFASTGQGGLKIIALLLALLFLLYIIFL